MRIESKLCHVSENIAIVKVSGWMNEKNVGSSLGQGSTVEIAEDNAIARLNKRLSNKNLNDTKNNINSEIKSEDKVVTGSKDDQIAMNNKLYQEPSDWSNELTAIDSEIERLNWSRDDEIKFLENNLGYNNRSKITDYNQLVNYLTLLKKADSNTNIKPTIINKEIMIEESDRILKDLSWDNKKGRDFLQNQFNVSTRHQLNEQQLISFVSKLKSIRDKT